MATAETSTPAAWQPTLVCASLTARVPREMAAEVAAAAALGADVAELQVGCLDSFEPCRDLPVLLAQPRSLPVIVTYRFASSSRGHLLGAFCEHLVLAGFSTIERGICFFFFVVFRLCFYCTISGTICICSFRACLV
jgi:hypothetical protein